MNIILKQGIKFIWSHIMSIAVSFFMMFAFGWFITKFGMYKYSIITAIIYFSFIYSESWNFGRLEGKPYNPIRQNPLRALLSALIACSVGIIFMLLIAFNFYPLIVSIIAKIWFVPFIGLYNTNTNITLTELAYSTFSMPIIAFIGYYVGTFNFSLTERMSQLMSAKRRKTKNSK